MNKYNLVNDYYNYVNNNYNQPIYNQSNFNNSSMNNNTNKIYDPYNGFIRGNMFSDLYNTYKTSKPFEIRPMNEQAELLTYIDALTFATIDLNLYLDIYPDDQNALSLFNQYRTQLNEYTRNYENSFGPLLTRSNALESYPWAWDDNPWPWQKK